MKGLMTAASAVVMACSAVAVELTVDFSGGPGRDKRLKTSIHSSGWGPRSYPRSIQNDDTAVKAMNLAFARTHDWALVNSGQRVVDYQYIFPLVDKDPKDPSNYYFEPTDYLLSLSRDLGLRIFYRLGTSIEHTGLIHFNAAIPKDFGKVAEVFAATVRHYNKGWANGHEWGVDYWEIWNEPDGNNDMWCYANGKDDRDEEIAEARKKLFIKFFVIALKRLKTEFPDIKVGGPALASLKPGYLRELLQACKDAGVAPDFVSWHYYGDDDDWLLKTGTIMRRMCDEFGFSKTELIVNEYHYLLSWDGVHGRNATSAMVRRALEGPAGLNNIDAACFYLTMLSRFQDSPVDQAYWYGCGADGNFGYMDQYKQFNKPYYAAKMFGGIVKGYQTVCEVRKTGTITTLALKSSDDRRRAILAKDYRGTDQMIEIDVRSFGWQTEPRVSAVVLDNAHDNLPSPAAWRDGHLTLVKSDANSAAFLVTFER